jgi:ATPase subunit of ABC transporter with duplicated ATPase domains
MDLVSKINEIIARRKIKAEAIQTKINFLEKLRKKVSGLKKLQEVINFQIESKQGQYYALLGNDPIMQVNVSAIDLAFFIERLDRQLEVLKKMKARFERESVCISVVGLARQGKSMLLQTIAGLSDKVIPTSDGTDCTGAPSKIYNADAKKLGKAKVLAEIIFMNEAEILDAVNSYTQKLFPEIRINSCTEIPALKDRLEELRKSCPGELEKFLHFEKYVIKYEEYSPFIGKTISCNDEKEIIVKKMLRIYF